MLRLRTAPTLSSFASQLRFGPAMKTRILSILGTAALLVQGFCSPAFGADVPVKTSHPAIYDENADAAKQIADAAKQIADALSLAKKEDKRVLLQFGANWRGW